MVSGLDAFDFLFRDLPLSPLSPPPLSSSPSSSNPWFVRAVKR
jgi:hypothetical protein